MQFTSTFTLLALLVSAAFSAPTKRTVKRSDGETSGRLIVTLKDGVAKADVLATAGVFSTSDYDDWEIINAFVVDDSEEIAAALLANPDVLEVAEDVIMYTQTTQTNAPWGIARLSSTSKLSNQDTSALTYTYTYTATGSGVDVYVVDTGVRTTHSQFGGRAKWGATYGGYANADGNGHGTHCAGTIAGSQYGVAKGASIVAVKVLSDAGSGSTADIVSGLNYVLAQSKSTGRPSIVSMSLGGSTSTALDNAVATLTSGGVHVVVAAGNSNTDAGSTSPARAPSAITVGASTIADARSSFSNYGSVVDVFAPGTNIISSWGTSDTATNNISGTSMATPHVAGLVAYLISLNGNGTPAALQTSVKNLALKSVLTGIPSGTVNYLAHNA